VGVVIGVVNFLCSQWLLKDESNCEISEMNSSEYMTVLSLVFGNVFALISSRGDNLGLIQHLYWRFLFSFVFLSSTGLQAAGTTSLRILSAGR